MFGFFRKNIFCIFIDCATQELWYEFLNPNVFNRIGAIDGISRLRHDSKIYRVMEVIGDNTKDFDAMIYLKYECEYDEYFGKTLRAVKEGTDKISRADKEAAKWEARRKAEDDFGIPV